MVVVLVEEVEDGVLEVLQVLLVAQVLQAVEPSATAQAGTAHRRHPAGTAHGLPRLVELVALLELRDFSGRSWRSAILVESPSVPGRPALQLPSPALRFDWLFPRDPFFKSCEKNVIGVLTMQRLREETCTATQRWARPEPRGSGMREAHATRVSLRELESRQS